MSAALQLAGRTAFVTGGANGVGLGIARALLAEGCQVAIADVSEESLAAALKSLENQPVIGVALDVSSRSAFADAADRVERDLGPVSLLFNNAGVNLFQTIDDSSYDDWDWLLGVNLHGVINGVATFVPRMKERGAGGHVCNTASMAAFLGSAVPGIYNTTKFAVRGLSESLRYSLAPHGIGVSMLCPGLVKSQIYRSDDVRPETLRAGAKAVNAAFVDQLQHVHEAGMEPEVIARRTIDAILENRFYIFSHPEFRDELEEVFAGIVDQFRPYPPDPGLDARLKIEEGRRTRYREARKAALPA